MSLFEDTDPRALTELLAEIQIAIGAVPTLNSELNKAFPKNANP